MAFPVVESSSNTAFGTATSSHVITMPSGVVSGDLLFISFTTQSTSVTVTPPVGWSALQEGTYAKTYYKISDGTEGGSETFTTSSNSRSASAVARISGAQAPVDVTEATGSSNTPNPPGLTPAGGADDILWLALFGSTNGSSTITTNPSGYTVVASSLTGGTSGCATRISRLDLNAATEDPGNYIRGTAVSWNAQTVAIYPGGGGGAGGGGSTNGLSTAISIGIM